MAREKAAELEDFSAEGAAAAAGENVSLSPVAGALGGGAGGENASAKRERERRRRTPRGAPQGLGSSWRISRRCRCRR